MPEGRGQRKKRNPRKNKPVFRGPLLPAEGIQRERIPAPEAEDGSLLAAVDLLPPKYRAVIYLYYYEGYAAKEIGALLGLPTATVNTQLARGREKLKNLLESEGYV